MELLQSYQILLLTIAFLAKAHSGVIPTDLECTFNKEICSPSYCFLSKGRGKFKYLSSGCNFIKPISSAFLHVDILRKTKAGAYTDIDFKIAEDICHLDNVKGGILNNVISMSIKSLVNVKCPLQGNITITKMPLMVFLMQGLLPEADYKFFIRVLNGVQPILKMNVSIRVTSDKR